MIPGERIRAAERDVTYRLTDLELFDDQPDQFSSCLETAFVRSGFPEPRDDAPLWIHHHIVVDYCVINATLQALSDSAQ